MSKESALAMAGSTQAPTPSIVTGELPQAEVTPNPGLTGEQTENPVVKEKLDSERYALIAKKEAKLVREREEFKKEQARLADEKTRLTEFHTKITEFEDLRKKDPIAALKHIGFTETEIFNYLSDDAKPGPTPEEIAAKAAQEAIDNYDKKQQEIQSQAQKARDDSLVSNFKSQISESIEANKDKYEYVAFNGPFASELAFDVVNQVLKDSGGTELISIDEALEMVENYYEEQDKAMSALKKRQPKLETPSEAVKVEPERTTTITPPASPNPAPKTITNKAGITASSALKRHETTEQKKARLIDALKNGKL